MKPIPPEPCPIDWQPPYAKTLDKKLTLSQQGCFRDFKNPETLQLFMRFCMGWDDEGESDDGWPEYEALVRRVLGLTSEELWAWVEMIFGIDWDTEYRTKYQANRIRMPLDLTNAEEEEIEVVITEQERARLMCQALETVQEDLLELCALMMQQRFGDFRPVRAKGFFVPEECLPLHFLLSIDHWRQILAENSRSFNPNRNMAKMTVELSDSKREKTKLASWLILERVLIQKYKKLVGMTEERVLGSFLMTYRFRGMHDLDNLLQKRSAWLCEDVYDDVL